MSVELASGPLINRLPRTPASTKPGATRTARRTQCVRNFGTAPSSPSSRAQMEAEEGAVGHESDTLGRRYHGFLADRVRDRCQVMGRPDRSCTASSSLFTRRYTGWLSVVVFSLAACPAWQVSGL